MGEFSNATRGVGRPVRISSISFANGRSLEEIAALVDREGARGIDLLALPETWLGQAGHEPEPLDGPTIRCIAGLAQKHHMYVVCPIDRLGTVQAPAHAVHAAVTETPRLNSAVLIDRTGRVACVYDKVYPYWAEFDVTPIVSVGLDAPVFEADFGHVGMSICFDANFPEVWKRLADQGAELAIWPSAYSAGTTLQTHALANHMYIVTSTQTCDCVVYDITGQEIFYEKSPDLNISRVTLDLDRGIYHENFNIERRDRLLAEHGDDVEQEQFMQREQWFVLRARRPGVSARALAREYGLEELRDYINRSRRDIDKMRGWAFAEKVK